jgi:hypothetical protein
LHFNNERRSSTNGRRISDVMGTRQLFYLERKYLGCSRKKNVSELYMSVGGAGEAKI